MSVPEGNNLPGTHEDRRVSAYRERVGYRVMERETNRILERLQVHLVEQFAELAKDHGSGTTTSVPLPVTTRGIGFNSQLFLDQMSLRNRHVARVMPTAAPLYRVSLLQAKKQLYHSQSVGLSLTPDDVYPAAPKIMNDPRFKDLSNENSFLMKLVIDCFGCVEDASRLYRPYVPSYSSYPVGTEAHQRFKRYEAEREIWQNLIATLRENRVDERMAGPGPNPVPQAPPPVMVEKVDPYLVTFDNLRATVTALADPEYPQEWRAHFRRFNPIPSAIWDGDILTNPDHIMPANYGERQYAADNAAVVAFLGTIKGKDQNYVCPMNFTGLGGKLSLATLSHVEHRGEPAREFSIQGAHFPAFTIRNSSVLEAATLMSSVLAMSSELPPGSEGDEQWAIRSPRLSMRRVDYSWFSLANDVTNTRY